MYMKTEKIVTGSGELTMDELWVADLLLMGYSQKKIGEKLNLPQKEVRGYCSSIILKRGCKSRKELLEKGAGFVLKGRN